MRSCGGELCRVCITPFQIDYSCLTDALVWAYVFEDVNLPLLYVPDGYLRWSEESLLPALVPSLDVAWPWC